MPLFYSNTAPRVLHFIVLVDKVVKQARRECVREVPISTGTIGILIFADDMVMMAETEEALSISLSFSCVSVCTCVFLCVFMCVRER